MDLITKIRQAEGLVHAASEHTGFIKKFIIVFILFRYIIF